MILVLYTVFTLAVWIPIGASPVSEIESRAERDVPIACPLMQCPPMPDVCRQAKYDARGCRVCDENVCRGPIPVSKPESRAERDVSMACPLIQCPQMPDVCRQAKYDARGCRDCDENVCRGPSYNMITDPETKPRPARSLSVACPVMVCPSLPYRCRRAQYDARGCRICDKNVCRGPIPQPFPHPCPLMVCPSMPDICREAQYDVNGCRICDKNACRGPIRQ